MLKIERKTIVAVTAGLAAAFHMFAAYSPFTALIQRPIHLAFMSILGFIGADLLTKGSEPSRSSKYLSTLLASLTVLSCIYLVSQNQVLVSRSGSPTTVDLVAGGITILLVLELARRFTGYGLVTVSVFALAFAFSGPYLPGVLAHRGYGIKRLIEHLYLSTEGI